MGRKLLILILAIITSIIANYIYLVSFRADLLEQKLTSSMDMATNKIIKSYTKMNIKNSESQTKSKFLKEIYKNNPGLALFIITDNNYTLKMGSKNDKFITGEKLYNSIINDFNNGKLNPRNGQRYLKKYYYSSSASRIDEKKLYFLSRKYNNEKFLAVFPYTINKMDLIQLSIELLLISLSCIFIIILITIMKQKRSFNKLPDTEHEINLAANKSTIETEINYNSGGTVNIASDTLNSYVYEFFKRIYSKYNPDTVSLYILSKPNILSKNYEFKGRSFIKIDSDTFDTMDINNQLGNELKNSQVIIIEHGTRVIFPLLNDKSLIGVINIKRERSFDGNEISVIRKETSQITRHIIDFMVVNNVIVDRETGLYSKTFFNIKYNELLKLSIDHDRDFSLVMILLSKSLANMNKEDRNLIFKIVSPAVSEQIKTDNYLCSFDNYIALLLPGVRANQADSLAEKLKEKLQKFRIKINPAKTLPVNPHLSVVSSDSIDLIDEMLPVALKSIEEDTSGIIEKVN